MKHDKSIVRTAGCVALLSVFSLAVYGEMFSFPAFGPEFPLFYFYNDGLTFTQMLRGYTYTGLMWYRPTAFALFYWIGQQWLDWHNLSGWRAFHFTTVLATVYALYWLVVACLGRGRTAGLLAAVFFVSQPSLYTSVVEVAAFDFIHVLLALVCAGCYLRRRESPAATVLGWACFVAALTAKEMALAIPFYLLAVTLLDAVWHERWRSGAELRREALRLLPFFAMLPVYYFFHVVKIPPGTFPTSGPYRTGVNWSAIFDNLRKFSLWIPRIYVGTGDPPGARMYLSTAANNAAGIAALVVVAVQWWRHARAESDARLLLLRMLAWMAVFLALPVYAGGYLWHTILPMAGYAVLFGTAAAWTLERAPAGRWRPAAAAALLAGVMLLARADLHHELYGGSHTPGFRINHSLLGRPPAAADTLGPAPLVYIEDRLNLGPWWYGCFGKLFNYTYRRHDVEEVIVPAAGKVSPLLRERWLAHPNAHFFSYDDEYDWHDGTAAFRAASLSGGGMRPTQACLGAGGSVRFSFPGMDDGTPQPWEWSVAPAGRGSIDSSGLYRAPETVPHAETVRVAARRQGDKADWVAASLTLASAGPIRVAAGGGRWTDRAGRVWEADTGFTGGAAYANGNPIAGTDSPELYQHERFNEGPFSYTFCVPEGLYTVRLKFAEIWFREPGRRVYDVVVNGRTVLRKFDPLAAAGEPNRAVDREFRVAAEKHEVRIDFRPVVGNPKVSAIEIVPLPAARPTATRLSGQPRYRNRFALSRSS